MATDTLYRITKDTTVIVKDNAEVYVNVLQNISNIASWIALLSGILGIIITIGLAFFGIKWFRDVSNIKKMIKETVESTRASLTKELDEKLNNQKSDLEKISKEALTESKKRDLSIWVRGIVLSEKKDIFAIVQAINLACELKDEDSALGMISETFEYAKRNPAIINQRYWDIIGIEKAINNALAVFGDRQDSKSIIEGYLGELKTIKDRPA